MPSLATPTRRCRPFALFSLLILAAAPLAAQNNAIPARLKQQIEELMAEKIARTPAQKKIDSHLLHTLKMRHGQRITASIATLASSVPVGANGTVDVQFQANVSDALLLKIKQAGGSIVSSFPDQNYIHAVVPIEKLETLASDAAVMSIEAVPPAMTNTGKVTSEGDITHHADTARNSFLVNGTGVKVGVLSDSDDSLLLSQSTSDLGTVTVLPGQSGVPGTGEGTAMLEIVHDLAPGASLYFATGNPDEPTMAANIRALRTAGCDVIVDDLTYSDESPFQPGVIEQAVNDVAANGALYFSSAGNSGSLTDGTSSVWEGDFVNSGTTLTYRDVSNNIRTGTVHSFGSANYDTVLTGGYQYRANLFWSDPLGHAADDYDLVATNAAGTVVGVSDIAQTGSQNPYEWLDPVQPGWKLYIVRVSGNARYLHLNVGRGRLAIATAGRVQGHNSAANAFTVAAVDVHTTSSAMPFVPVPFVGGTANPVETFSSDGPRHVFYNADGSAITPGNLLSSGGIMRPKPDIAAADGVTTTVPTKDKNGNYEFIPFYGTSAAAPHAGAIAALLKSYSPTATTTQIHTALTASALDIMATGFDRDSGNGLIVADDALLEMQAIAPPANPGQIMPNANISGAYGKDGGPVRRYSYTTTSDGDSIFTISSGSQLVAAVTFYDSDGTTYLSSAGSTYGNPGTFTIPHLGPGTYYLDVSYQGGYGSYSVTSSFVPPISPTEHEINDTLALALPLGDAPLNTYKRMGVGNLGYSRHPYGNTDSTDWYSIHVTQDCELDLQLGATPSNFATAVTFYDQDGTTYLTSVGTGYGGQGTIVVPHLGPGTYFVQITNQGGYGTYDINARIIPPTVNDPEINDTPEQAISLGNVPNAAQGRLGWSRIPYGVTDSTDWYKIHVTAVGDLTLKIAAVQPDFAAAITLYANDHANYLTSVGTGYGGTGSVTYTHLGPADYYVQVTNQGGFGYYTLTTSFNALTVLDPEPNDTVGQADVLALGGSVRGSLGYSLLSYDNFDSTDWYKVTVPQDGDIKFTVAADQPGFALALTLYDQDGTTYLTSIGTGYGGTASLTLPHVTAGTYYAQLTNQGGYGTYTLSDQWLPQTAPNDAEPADDTAAGAVLLAIGQTAGGRLGYSRTNYGVQDSDDWYRFTIAGDSVSLRLNLSPGLRGYLTLTDADGSGYYGSSPLIDTAGIYTVGGLSPGTYAVHLSRYDGYGAYTLRANVTTVAISGTVAFDSVDDLSAVAVPTGDVTLAFHDPGSPVTLFTRTATLAPVGAGSPNGTFTLTGVPTGTYDIGIKSTKSLRAPVPGVNASNGNLTLPGVTTLPGGDADNNNIVNFDDFLTLLNAFGSTLGDPNSGYDPAPDFNYDGKINFDDFLILLNNFGAAGSP